MINYFIALIDTDTLSLHLVYNTWDTTIGKVKSAIYRHEGKEENA